MPVRRNRGASAQHRRNNRNIPPKQAWVNSRVSTKYETNGACDDPDPPHPRRPRVPGRDRRSGRFRADVQHQGAFDGGWSVLIVTEKGTCDRAYRYPVKIQNGAVGYAGSASFTVSGQVGDNGAVTVMVARGSQSAKGTGRMSGNDGSGTWTAGSGECSGTWTAERRS